MCVWVMSHCAMRILRPWVIFIHEKKNSNFGEYNQQANRYSWQLRFVCLFVVSFLHLTRPFWIFENFSRSWKNWRNCAGEQQKKAQFQTAKLAASITAKTKLVKILNLLDFWWIAKYLFEFESILSYLNKSYSVYSYSCFSLFSTSFTLKIQSVYFFSSFSTTTLRFIFYPNSASEKTTFNIFIFLCSYIFHFILFGIWVSEMNGTKNEQTHLKRVYYVYSTYTNAEYPSIRNASAQPNQTKPN